MQVFPYRSQAFRALHGICLAYLITYLVQQGSPGTAMTSCISKCHKSLCFAQFLSHWVTLSCAGLSIQIPGIQGTAWDLFGLPDHLSGPTGVTRDCNDLLYLKVSQESLLCTILVTLGDIILCRSFHTDSRHSGHCMGSDWTCCTQIWSNRGHQGL